MSLFRTPSSTQSATNCNQYERKHQLMHIEEGTSPGERSAYSTSTPQDNIQSTLVDRTWTVTWSHPQFWTVIAHRVANYAGAASIPLCCACTGRSGQGLFLPQNSRIVGLSEDIDSAKKSHYPSSRLSWVWPSDWCEGGFIFVPVHWHTRWMVEGMGLWEV